MTSTAGSIADKVVMTTQHWIQLPCELQEFAHTYACVCVCVHASACQTEDDAAAAVEINDSATHYAAAHHALHRVPLNLRTSINKFQRN